MKKSTIYALAALILAACSAPKYSYNFSTHDYSSSGSVKKAHQMESIGVMVSAQPEGMTHEVSSVAQSLLTENYEGSEKPLNNKSPLTNMPATDQKRIPTVAGESRKENKEAKIAIKREIKAAKKAWKEERVKQNANASKNGYAIAGFICSIVGLFVLWPLCIIGLIFSAIGLKSERKGLAIAGLVIGIIGVVLVIAAGAALAAA